MRNLHDIYPKNILTQILERMPLLPLDLGLLYIIINIKKLQFIQVLTASCIDLHIENSKNDKKVILTTITSPKRQCDAE